MSLYKSAAVITAVAALGSGLALASAGIAGAAQPDFSFGSVEYQPYDVRMRAAQAFVARAAPVGAAVQDAVRRLRRADADCGARSRAGGDVTCHYAMLAHPSGGTLGEVTWTVTLSQDGRGRLTAARVQRSRTGLGDD